VLIMKLHLLLGAVLLSCAVAFPASAQLGQVERSKAEIALEEAEGRQAKQKTAREAAETACAAENMEACFKLADMQRKGLGGMQDLKAAAKTYMTLCEARDGRGCAGLAYLTVQGRGVLESQAEGRALYKKACDYGDVSGCAAFGNMAFTGAGGSKDTVAGTRALANACDRDYEWACTRMRDLGVYDPDDNSFERLKDIRG
jgi:TPR repeat protein